MTLALGSLLAAVLIGSLGPLYLRVAMRTRLRPGMLLTGWIGSVVVAATCAAAAGVLLGLPTNGAADTVLGMAAVCVNTGAHLWETLARLAGLGLVLAAAVRVAVVAVRMRRHGADHRARHLAALSVLGAAQRQHDAALFWLPGAAPMAYSIGGRRRTIVASSGVARLDPATRAAILEHERAHLGGHHHGLVRMVEVLARALPFVPLLRAAVPAVRILVELSADEVAAARCGAGQVREALRVTSGRATPAGSLAMSGEATELRLRRLAPRPHRTGGALRRGLGHAAAACAVSAPALLGVAFTAGVILLLCVG